jgi:hypothetical protein
VSLRASPAIAGNPRAQGPLTLTPDRPLQSEVGPVWLPAGLDDLHHPSREAGGTHPPDPVALELEHLVCPEPGVAHAAPDTFEDALRRCLHGPSITLKILGM